MLVLIVTAILYNTEKNQTAKGLTVSGCRVGIIQWLTIYMTIRKPNFTSNSSPAIAFLYILNVF